jgi:DNA-binding NtrC family response regulator
MNQKTILVVDDDRDILFLFKESLEEMSFKVLVASEPLWALENVSFSEVDCIITDILMPGIDGVEFIKKVLELGHKPKIFFISAYNDYPREVLNSLKPSAIIFKPFDTEEACLLIKKHLSK